ncbi:hypothetical protein [Halococcoides cellulosivorans]|uniref:Uncharacterized protein n=1 Tax=Halococcoides cellulosivorans TaxID=1679096 RepID=A0A2R4X3F9_9EURY|nr:hypothetical protein [Halococcoides cellulosivorans]AWB28334.1 hypothetical protein HARCEL1_11760 [Halococcoides cellulosivorans]
MHEETDELTVSKRDPAGESRVAQWVLLDGNRLVITALLVVAMFVSFVGVVGTLGPPFADQIAAEDTIETIFATMLTVIVTGTTLVVTIGQLVLTQENGPLGDQRDRMDGSMAVRESVAELTGAPSPLDPAAFLQVILQTAAQRAEALRASVGDTTDGIGAEIDELASNVLTDAETACKRLDGAQFGTFEVIAAALGFDYSTKLYQLERIVDNDSETLDAADRQHLAELSAALELFGPAREHIKTLYFQWALIDLSQWILYAAVPALAVAGVMVGVVDAGTVPGATLGIDHIVIVVGAAFAVTLVPFMLFVASVLRILTVAKRTLAIEPLLLRE